MNDVVFLRFNRFLLARRRSQLAVAAPGGPVQSVAGVADGQARRAGDEGGGAVAHGAVGRCRDTVARDLKADAGFEGLFSLTTVKDIPSHCAKKPIS